MGKQGKGGTKDLILAMLTEIRSRYALSHVNAACRAIWITAYNGALLAELDLKAINNDKEIREAFPKETMETAGYPVVCWRYGEQNGRGIINEKKMIANATKYARRKCNCHMVDDKYKDESGHVVTADLDIQCSQQRRRTQ